MLKNACKYLHELKLEIDYNSDCSEAMEAKSDINMWKEKIQETCQILLNILRWQQWWWWQQQWWRRQWQPWQWQWFLAQLVQQRKVQASQERRTLLKLMIPPVKICMLVSHQMMTRNWTVQCLLPGMAKRMPMPRIPVDPKRRNNVFMTAVLILISFQWTQQCQALWCYVVSRDVKQAVCYLFCSVHAIVSTLASYLSSQVQQGAWRINIRAGVSSHLLTRTLLITNVTL